MLLLLLALSAAPPTPLEYADAIEVIGWNADESRVALRVFFGGEPDELELCPGYVGADGKPFRGGLALVVLEGEKVVNSFIIQKPRVEDPQQQCTPVAAAKEALTRAKASLDAAGIKREGAAGGKVDFKLVHGKPKQKHEQRKDGVLTRTDWTDRWTSAELSYEAVGNDVCDAEGSCTRSLATTLKAERGGAKKVLLERSFSNVEWSHDLAGGLSTRFVAFRSPSGRLLLPFLMFDYFRMDGGWTKSHFLGLAQR